MLTEHKLLAAPWQRRRAWFGPALFTCPPTTDNSCTKVAKISSTSTAARIFWAFAGGKEYELC
jgi:hypothetical protein